MSDTNTVVDGSAATTDVSTTDPTTIDPHDTEALAAVGKKGRKFGQGRPKGAKGLHTKDSRERLSELSFDPMEKLIQQYHKVQTEIDDMKAGKTRFSAMALSQYFTIQTNIMNQLIRYGYRPVPDRTEQVIEEKRPLKIILS